MLGFVTLCFVELNSSSHVAHGALNGHARRLIVWRRVSQSVLVVAVLACTRGHGDYCRVLFLHCDFFFVVV